MTDKRGSVTTYEYDGTGRLANLKDEDGTTLTEYAYTTAGRIKEIRTSDGATASYTYDSDGNISRLRIENTERNEILYDSFMLYDLNGNRISKTGQQLGADRKIKELHTAYRYDSMNRLTEESRKTEGEKYAYDLCGNRLTKESYRDGLIDGTESYSYNERNELTERNILSAAIKYLYDENGNLVSEKEGERETSYRYDLLNRQTHAITKDGREQENLYDGEGLRAGIKENGKVTSFLYYNGEILAECDGDSAPIRRHLAGQGLSHVQTLEDGLYHTYHQDEQGSTAYITGSNGTVENCYLYDAFGNIRESHEDIKNRILYTGQQYDQETGQYYLRARYYNPVIGRFTQEDTYRGDGLNLYAYCANNPVMYYDPSGHEQQDYNVTQQQGDRTPAGQVSNESGRRTDFYVTPDGAAIPANGVKTNSQYDRLEVEKYSGKSVRPNNAIDDWNNFLGPDQTDINPFTGQSSPDRIWSTDGTRSIRFGDHEMGGMGTKNFHYHKETWYDYYVFNEVQRIQMK